MHAKFLRTRIVATYTDGTAKAWRAVDPATAKSFARMHRDVRRDVMSIRVNGRSVP